LNTADRSRAPGMGERRFIGRANELAAFDEALALARAGQGRTLLLAGPPGIGKTRTVQAVAEHAAASDMLVLWGRCPEESGAPPYWPWLQLFRGFVATHDANAFHAVVGTAAPHLAGLDPNLVSRLPAHQPLTPLTDAAQARFQLFDAITGFWQRVATGRPLLLLFEDLHCADVPSLKLLEFMVRESAASALLIVGTYRDAEVTRTHPLQDTLGMLARQPSTQRIKLGGFSQEETAQFIETALRCPAPELTAALYQRTEGHPLFLVELARLLEDSRGCALTDLRRVPAGVREAIGSRLNRVSPLCNRALGAAAVIGRSFNTKLLCALLDEVSVDECAAVLDEARRASLIEEQPDATAWQFTHMLIRDALYDDMPVPPRMRLHQRIAETLQALHGDAPNWFSTLAHHYLVARSWGGADKAVEYCVRAAQQAETTLAYEEAARLYQCALEALEPARDTQRCELLLALGEAQTRAGRNEAGLEVFAEAAGVARRLGAGQALARAALGYETCSWRGSGVGVVAAAMIKEALAANPPLDSVQRARLLAALCRALVNADRVDAAVAIHGQAVGMARRLQDTEALFAALAAIVPARWRPDLLALRLAAGREAMAIAQRTGNPDWAVGHLTGWHVGDLVEAGDMEAAARAVAFGADAALIRHQPFGLTVLVNCRAMLALHAGRFDEAEQLVNEGLRHASRFSQVSGATAVQLFTARREQGRLAEVAPVLEHFQRTMSDNVTWQPGYIVLCCELGRREQAQAAFERVARLGFEIGSPSDGARTGGLVYLAEACRWLGDASRAATLYTLLLPHAGKGIVFGANVASLGSADRVLGMLAAAMQRWDEAQAHFERAMAFDEASGARPWLAHDRYEHAAMLLERQETGDAQHASGLLDTVLAATRELGMRALETRVLALQPTPRNREQQVYPAGLTEREIQVLRMVAEGKTNQDIANALFRSVNTVANHVRHILAKIDAANRTEAAAFASRHGLLKR
jgi:DNA-binding CsgD family transcriptional regulator/DNA polymerase III delta prime subunit